MKLIKYCSCLMLCLCTFAAGRAQSADPRGETEARGLGRVPNPVVRRTGPAARRAPASIRARVMPTAKPDERVEEALELGNKARDTYESDKAKEFYNRALALNPREPRAYIGLGNVELDDHAEYLKEEDMNAAIKRAEAYFRKALALSPKEWSIHYGLGVVYDSRSVAASGTDRRLQDRAEASFKKAIALDPGVVEPRRRLAILYEEQSRHGEAIAVYRQALGLKSEDKGLLGDVYFRLGDLLRKQNRHAEAALVFQEWARANPQDLSPHYHLGMTYVKLGDKKAATEHYQILRQRNSTDAEKLMDEINKMKN